MFSWQISTYSEMRLPLTDLVEAVPSHIKSCMGRAERGVHAMHLYTHSAHSGALPAVGPCAFQPWLCKYYIFSESEWSLA